MKNLIFNLSHLKFFYDAARLESVTEAAKINFVSQSALSQGIKKLERDLDADLTTHQKNRFQLTDAGQMVFQHAQRLFVNIEEMREGLNLLKGEVAGTISFACTNSIARALIPRALVQCRKLYPLLKVKFHRGSVRFIKQQLQQGKVDFGVVVDGEAFDAFEKKTVKCGYFNLYAHPDFKGSYQDGIFVDHVDSPEMEGIDLKVLEELSGWGMVEEFVKQGLGPGLLPDFMEAARTMRKIDANLPEIPYEICAIRSSNLPFSNNMSVFIDLLNLLK